MKLKGGRESAGGRVPPAARVPRGPVLYGKWSGFVGGLSFRDVLLLEKARPQN